MKEEAIRKIENIFRNSISSDELFDTFQDALNEKFEDPEIFEILLGNPALSPDEIKMFTEKLIKEYPGSSFTLCMWTAKVFGSFSENYERREDALTYYIKASLQMPTEFEPYLRILNLYNYDLDLPTNDKIVGIVESGIPPVNFKNKIYYVLSEHYKKIGDLENASKYLALAEKAAEREGK
ncbi:MAG: hypothetical protein AB1775_11390 [Bacteroidota bacterium]